MSKRLIAASLSKKAAHCRAASCSAAAARSYSGGFDPHDLRAEIGRVGNFSADGSERRRRGEPLQDPLRLLALRDRRSRGCIAGEYLDEVGAGESVGPEQEDEGIESAPAQFRRLDDVATGGIGRTVSANVLVGLRP